MHPAKKRSRIILSLLAFLMTAATARAQFADASSGLLQMPSAEMQADGTFMITNNFLNKHALSPHGWGYNTFQYGFAISFWQRIELGYVCTIFNDHWKGRQSRPGVWMVNQDRHFTWKVRIIEEGDFGLEWLPSIALGVSDFDEGMFKNRGNGYFTRLYMVASKSFSSVWGDIGGHFGYQWSPRIDYHINAPCIGVNWKPVWLQDKGAFDGLNCIAEFDSRTVNLGFIASVWDNRFEAMFELQNFQWVNFGLRYKLRLKK